MTEWAKLTPPSAARPPALPGSPAGAGPGPPASWEAYQALPPEQRAAARGPRRHRRAPRRTPTVPRPRPRRARATAARPSPTSCPTRRWRSRPSRSRRRVVQAPPGATTTLSSRARPRRPRTSSRACPRSRRRPSSSTGPPCCRSAARRPRRSAPVPATAAAAVPARSPRSAARPAEPTATKRRRTAARSRAAGRRPPARRPALLRRMACFVYEATLLFGIALIAGVARRALLRPDRPAPSAAERRRRLRVTRWWSTASISSGSGRCAARRWRCRPGASASSPPTGARLSQARALARYVACCMRLVRAGDARRRRAATASAGRSLVAVVVGIVRLRAARAGSTPERQFWHDRALRHAAGRRRRRRPAARRR